MRPRPTPLSDGIVPQTAALQTPVWIGLYAMSLAFGLGRIFLLLPPIRELRPPLKRSAKILIGCPPSVQLCPSYTPLSRGIVATWLGKKNGLLIMGAGSALHWHAAGSEVPVPSLLLLEIATLYGDPHRLSASRPRRREAAWVSGHVSTARGR